MAQASIWYIGMARWAAHMRLWPPSRLEKQVQICRDRLSDPVWFCARYIHAYLSCPDQQHQTVC